MSPRRAATTLGQSAVAANDARERLLRTAYDLFCRHGLHAVGIDQIIAESDVAKTTLYRHFRSKEELAVAVVERREELWSRDWLEAEARRRSRTPDETLLVVFDVLSEWFRREDYEGCFFINSLLEEHDRTNPVAEASLAALANVRSFIRGLAEEVGVADPDDLAWTWQSLMWGSILAASFGDPHAASRSRDVAEMLLQRERP
jgi:AcrR family transcriptional regulator